MPETCHTHCLVNGTATQAMIAVVESRNLALSDSFEWFIKRNLYTVRGPALAHRNRDRGHAMADLCARSKALMRKRGSWWSVAPNPREIIRYNTRSEQCRVTAGNASQKANIEDASKKNKNWEGKRKAAPTLRGRRRSHSFDGSYRRQRASWLDQEVSRLGRLCRSTGRCVGPIGLSCRPQEWVLAGELRISLQNGG